MTFEELSSRAQFSIPQPEKEELLLKGLRELVELHRDLSPEYARVLNAVSEPGGTGLEEIPYLPVNLFKNHLLKSIQDHDVKRHNRSIGQPNYSGPRNGGAPVHRAGEDHDSCARAVTATDDRY